MKRILTMILALLLILALAGCGGKKPAESASGNAAPAASGGAANAEDIAEQMLEEAAEYDAFSEAAAVAFFKANCGIAKEPLEPDWAYIIDESRMTTYGDKVDYSYGHGILTFEKPDGAELSNEEYDAWMEKVFKATAAVSDDGYNVYGFNFNGNGQEADAEFDFPTLKDSWMQGWCYRCGGKYLAVYVSRQYDNDRESTLDNPLYYYAASIDIGPGLQKSFDDTMAEAEEYLEEHGDEVSQAISDYANN